MKVETVIGAAAKAAGVRVAVLCGPTREAKVSTYRWSAMVILRDQGLSSTVIARLLGRRDHSTVLHAIDKIEGLAKTDAQCGDAVGELLSQLRQRTT